MGKKCTYERLRDGLINLQPRPELWEDKKVIFIQICGRCWQNSRLYLSEVADLFFRVLTKLFGRRKVDLITLDFWKASLISWSQPKSTKTDYIVVLF